MESTHPLNHIPAVPCARCAAIDPASGLLSRHRIELDLEHGEDDGGSGPWRRRLAIAAGVLPGAVVHATGVALALSGPATELAGMVLTGMGAIAMVAIPAFVCYRPRFSSWQQARAERDNYGGAAAAGV